MEGRTVFSFICRSRLLIHILPTAEFLGKSGTTEYGDFVLMCDEAVGRVNRWLKENHLEEDTILIFTSDNGCSPRANYRS